MPGAMGSLGIDSVAYLGNPAGKAESWVWVLLGLWAIGFPEWEHCKKPLKPNLYNGLASPYFSSMEFGCVLGFSALVGQCLLFL